MSHHHFDHSGGLRAAVSEGLTIVTHESNKAYFEEATGRKHSLLQDALAKKPQALKIETVGAEQVVEDASRRMELYHINGNPHADTLLMAYFPKERILVQADIFHPVYEQQPWGANLVENIDKRKLKIDKHAPLHGAIKTSADFAKAMAGAPKPAATN